MLYKWQVVWETRGRSSQLTQLREDREASQRRWPWSKDLKRGWNYAREREQHVKVIAAEKYDPMRKKGYFWMSEAENPCRVWACGVEANRWVRGTCATCWRCPGNASQSGRQRHSLTMLWGAFKTHALWRTNWQYLSKVQMHSSSNPAMTHLVIIPRDKWWRHIGTRLPITALLMKAEDWDKTFNSINGDWLNKLW